MTVATVYCHRAIQFYAEADPSAGLRGELARLAPANPLYTSAYIEAQCRLGFRPWILGLRDNGKLVSGCTAFTKSGYLNRELAIRSLPVVANDSVFWEGLLGFCREQRISRLTIDTFASTNPVIPGLPGERRRMARCEFVLFLQEMDLWRELHTKHRQRVNRARKAGIKLLQASDGDACRQHVRMMEASIRRRVQRGETASVGSGARDLHVYTRTGAAQLFQAVLDGEVVSSVLVLLAEKGALYTSGGTSKNGMTLGASHFLLHEVSQALKEGEKDLFNLGGASDPKSGLREFKARFGGTAVDLEAADFYLAGKLRKMASDVIRRLRGNLAWLRGAQ